MLPSAPCKIDVDPAARAFSHDTSARRRCAGRAPCHSRRACQGRPVVACSDTRVATCETRSTRTRRSSGSNFEHRSDACLQLLAPHGNSHRSGLNEHSSDKLQERQCHVSIDLFFPISNIWKIIAVHETSLPSLTIQPREMSSVVVLYVLSRRNRKIASYPV